jgi:hypothetical protein
MQNILKNKSYSYYLALQSGMQEEQPTGGSPHRHRLGPFQTIGHLLVHLFQATSYSDLE